MKQVMNARTATGHEEKAETTIRLSSCFSAAAEIGRLSARLDRGIRGDE
jgi:hypothetical protein